MRGEQADPPLLVCPACGPLRNPWQCPDCGDHRLRAPQVGVSRTAEELGRAFPQTRVVQSWSGHKVEAIDDEPALVLATPGAEPVPEAGYAAAVLLDAAVMLGRPDLRAAEEALRRWLSVCALVRPASNHGTVIAVGEPDSRALQALVRVDAAGFAERELAERAETRFPPAARMALIEGPRAFLDEAEAAWRPLPGAECFGPVPLTPAEHAVPEPEHGPATDGVWRATVRCPPQHGDQLVTGLRAVLGARLARKAPGAMRLVIDPAAF
ncbi:MAG: hypothetical protein QM708_00245 [Propioniciclava sp.]|uniref:hypothetical protein n=1 Tax=Propioniciclava sp. TaxID=2038686 RepID=UPI0039E65908